MKMKAAVLRKFQTPLVIEELEIPRLKCGQVLVKVFFSGICGAQLNHIAGVKTKKEFLPFLLGHEGSGEVVEIGDGVKSVRVDDKVVMHWRKGKGIESDFPKYLRGDGSTVGAGLITTFNEFAVVSENRVTTIPGNIPYNIAPLLGCSVTTGLGLINNEAKLKIGQSITVIGVGGVGLNIIQGAAMVSANPIIAVDRSIERLELAKKLGATHTINSLKVNEWGADVFKLPTLTDVCVDTTGIVELIRIAYNATKPGGKTIMVGQSRIDEFILLDSSHAFNDKVLMDCNGGLTIPEVDIARYLNLYLQGKLNLDDLISVKYTLEQINEALDAVRDLKFPGKCLVEMNHD